MKKYLFLALLLISGLVNAQAPSPAQYLGYEPGAKFTPHYKIVSYFRAVAAAVPSMVKVEKYGETYEGRELMVAYISAPENISRLEQIRSATSRPPGCSREAAVTTRPSYG